MFKGFSGKFVFVAAFLAVAAQARLPLLNEFSYGNVQSGRPYSTGLYRVQNAEVYTKKIRIETKGRYCNLDITGVEYTRYNGDFTRPAEPAGGMEFTIPEGRVSALNVHFVQREYTNVDCTLRILQADAQDPSLIEWSYGGVTANTSLTTGWSTLEDAPVRTRRVRIATIGNYCNLTITGFSYTAYAGAFASAAYPESTAGVWFVPDGAIQTVKIDFVQTRWTNVSCKIKLYSAD